MIIKFKLGDLYNILDQYIDLFDNLDSEWVETNDGYMFSASRYRIILSELDLSFREGNLFFRNDTIEDKKSDDAWDFAHSVDIFYAGAEKDFKKYLGYSDNINYMLKSICETSKIAIDDFDSLDCYIDTSEFIDEDTLLKIYPMDSENEAKTKYPELFSVINGQKYKLSKNNNKINFYIYSKYADINISFSEKEIRFEHCEWDTIIEKSKEKFKSTYIRIVELTKQIINEEVVFLRTWANNNENQFIPFEEAKKLESKESFIEFLADSGIDIYNYNMLRTITVDVYYWNEPNKRISIWQTNPGDYHYLVQK